MKNIFNINRIAFVVLGMLFIGGIIGSCSEDRLNLRPINDTEADFFKTETDFVASVGGIYAKLGDRYTFNNNNPEHGFWLLPGDDITTNGGFRVNFEVFSSLESGVGALAHHYGIAYQTIARANTFLDKVRNEEIVSVITTANLADNLEGEALFLRGFMNLFLWNYFGTAPLINQRITSTDGITPPNSTDTELIDQAIEDFQTAAALLPTAWDASNRGRVTKNSAYGMLGKALVIRGSWTGANADYTSAITAFGNISGASLMADFTDNFDVLEENNSESLFEYQSSNVGTDNVWLSNDNFSSIGTFSAYWGFYENHWSMFGKPPYIGTDKLINAFEAGDPRAALTVDPGDSRIQKYWTNDQKTGTGVGSFNNPRILRYADVLLLWAEALNETGDQDGAIALINQVRTRARNMDVTGVPADRPNGANQSQVRQWVMDERFLELAGEEGHRWIDLRRWHKAGHINLDSFDFSSNQTLEIDLPKHLLYPIPNSELDRNPNVVQNSEY